MSKPTLCRPHIISHIKPSETDISQVRSRCEKLNSAKIRLADMKMHVDRLETQCKCLITEALSEEAALVDFIKDLALSHGLPHTSDKWGFNTNTMLFDVKVEEPS